MKTVFARALVACFVVALPASAFASQKSTHHSVAKKEPSTKREGKHHSHKTTAANKPSAAPAASKAAKAH